MIIEKKTIIGKKGKTVLYDMGSIVFDSESESLSYPGFDFYTPIGIQADVDGNKYFPVPPGEITFERDTVLLKGFYLICKNGEETEFVEVLEGQESPMISIGTEGDIVMHGIIPPVGGGEIEVYYKEVIDGN